MAIFFYKKWEVVFIRINTVNLYLVSNSTKGIFLGQGKNKNYSPTDMGKKKN